MSGLLQRVAGQALGANAAGSQGNSTRIRPAATVHAQVPVGHVDSEQVVPTLRASWPVAADERRTSRPAQTDARPLVRSRAPEEPRNSATGTRGGANAAGTPALQPLVTTRLSPEAAALPRSPRSSTPEIRPPSPLLGDAQVAPALSPAITPAAPPRIVIDTAQIRGAAEPTEVHVHIGRIEVTAAPEPEAQKKSRPAPRRDTLPLSDYLARRRST